jgi:epsilon-lactone hydrolase
MTPTDASSVLHVPAREIPVPSHLSPEAQMVLSMGAMTMPDYPPLEDLDGWRASAAQSDEMMLAFLDERVAAVTADVEHIEVDGVAVYVITPDGIADDDPRVFLEIHGGGFIMGGGKCCPAMALSQLGRIGTRTWAVDYRMPPDHPYPTPLDDCFAAYRALLRDHQPEDIIVGGGSAGGNLAAAVVLRARDEGLPLPAAVVLLTPAVDMTHSGDTFHTNVDTDTVIGGGGAGQLSLMYAGGHDLSDPYLSPLFGDFTEGFPPTILVSGTRDLLLSNTVRMHRALRSAGVPAELHVMEAAPHGGFFGTAPEDREIEHEVRRFVDEHWRSR